MIRSFSQLLPQALRATWLPSGAARGFRAVADVEINLDDRETLKKYVGVRDHLSKEPGTRARFITAIRDLLEVAKTLPVDADYRKAVEATAHYRLKVVEANAAEADVEEVLDAHIEELMSECKEESRLISLMNENRPWDVPSSYTVPIFDYHDAADILNAAKK
ncbi:mitochondrial NADH:ubiquinone oxidoreductase 19-kd subunit variant A [Haematococcus lacustris]